MPKAKRGRGRRDSSVVRTEPDNRRATGNEDDDEFDIEETKAPERARRSSGVSRYQRNKTEKSSAKTKAEDDPFPFMRLPVEIRNMIYRYLVVSPFPHRINLDQERLASYDGDGIEIAILLTNHQIHGEAAKILYDENKCLAVYSCWDRGVAVRKDDPKTKSATSRSLRSGRAVDMIKHKGLIYPRFLQRLRHVEFNVVIFDRYHYCDHVTAFYAERLLLALSSLWAILSTRGEEFPEDSTLGRSWSIKLSNLGNLPLSVLRLVLLPILQPQIVRAVSTNKLKFEVEGEVPENWESMFHRMNGIAGFVTAEVKQAHREPREVDLEYLEEYFEGVREAWADPDDEDFFDLYY